MPELSRAIGRVALVGLVLNVVIGSSVFGLPSVSEDSQASAPTEATMPASVRTRPSPVRGWDATGREEDARGVLLSPIIQIPVGGWLPARTGPERGRPGHADNGRGMCWSARLDSLRSIENPSS